MQNYSKAAAGNYSFEIDRPSGYDPQETSGPDLRMATYRRKADNLAFQLALPLKTDSQFVFASII